MFQTPSIHIIDLGTGNTGSVANAVLRAGGRPVLVQEPEELAAADRLVLPGVGAAGDFLERLRKRNFPEALAEAVHQRGRPLLGICVGMQVLAEKLHEYGEHDGLRWFKGEVVPLGQLAAPPTRVPHMGWNDIAVKAAPNGPLQALRNNKSLYFCHSYTLVGVAEADIAATCDYGQPLVVALARDTVVATQFHPEKSQLAGAKLFEAFLDWAP